MINNNSNKNIVIIDDDLISQAILAVDSTDPTAEELETEQLAKLIPSIRMAMDRGESDEKIRRKIKSVIAKLHYTKLDALFETAKLASEQVDHSDQSLGGAQ